MTNSIQEQHRLFRLGTRWFYTFFACTGGHLVALSALFVALFSHNKELSRTAFLFHLATLALMLYADRCHRQYRKQYYRMRERDDT